MFRGTTLIVCLADPSVTSCNAILYNGRSPYSLNLSDLNTNISEVSLKVMVLHLFWLTFTKRQLSAHKNKMLLVLIIAFAILTYSIIYTLFYTKCQVED